MPDKTNAIDRRLLALQYYSNLLSRLSLVSIDSIAKSVIMIVTSALEVKKSAFYLTSELSPGQQHWFSGLTDAEKDAWIQTGNQFIQPKCNTSVTLWDTDSCEGPEKDFFVNVEFSGQVLCTPLIGEDDAHIGYFLVNTPLHTRNFDKLDKIILEILISVSVYAINTCVHVTRLRESEEKYRSIAETTVDKILHIDLSGNITYSSPWPEDNYGYDHNELMHHNIQEIIHEEDLGTIKKAMQSLRQGRVVTNVATRIAKKDGGYIYGEVNAAPLYRNDEIIGAQGVIRDITERKRAEHVLLEAKRLVETANQTKSHFLRSISHEFRTPMNAILGLSQLIELQSPLSEEQHESLEHIRTSGARLIALVDEALEMSQVADGLETLMPNPFELQHLLCEIHHKFKAQAEQKQLSFTMNSYGEMPEYIYADEGKLRQILVNIIGNATKFTDQGEIKLSVGVVNCASAADYTMQKAQQAEGAPIHRACTLVVEVEDTGCGIRNENLEKIFDIFEQPDREIHERGGIGLGMPISRQYARMMGGNVTVESTPDVGSLFHFECPVGIVSQDEHPGLTPSCVSPSPPHHTH